MAQNADIFFERDSWRGPLTWSAVLHCALFGGLVAYSLVIGGFRGNNWGSNGAGDGAMSATLVSTVPLPASPVVSRNVLANESKGLTQSIEQKVEPPPPDAIPIPEREAKPKPQKQIATPTHTKPVQTQPIEQPTNAVPYGQGGPVSSMYGFSAGAAKGGFGFSSGGGGDFGSRYGWYVDVVRRKVSENWLKYEVDPRVGNAQRCFVTFDITRSGEPTNVRLEQSSGVPSLDLSAQRALQRIDSFGPLPADYSGSKVSVEFWFDYQR
jgi:protein TonB